MLGFLRRIRGSGAPGSLGGPPSELALIEQHIDPDYYRRQFPDAPADLAGVARHYLETGWKLGLDPAEGFSTRAYLEVNGDVRASGMNPFLHFLRFGRDEGREPIAGRPTDQLDALDRHAAAIAEDFDVDFYKARNPDIDFSQINAVRHYLLAGAAEGRDPAPGFSTSYYLNANPDVRQQGINPFFHFITAGRREGRFPGRPGGFRTELLRRLRSLGDEVAGWRFDPPQVDPLDADRLSEQLERHLGTGSGCGLLTFSHDDYTSAVGGVQLVMQFEQAAFQADGVAYINLHPVQPLPVLAEQAPDREPLLHVLIDGTPAGIASPSAICTALGKAARRGAHFDLVVHSLHGHAPEHVAGIARAADVGDALYWVHDYFAVCAAHTLLRNKVAYCGAPAPESPACSICVFGEGRGHHVNRIRALFDAVPFTVVAPSEVALQIWQGGTSLTAAHTVVHPHCWLEETGSARPDRAPRDDRVIRVAFLGYPSVHKGWPVFTNLFRQLCGSADFAFYHLGAVHAAEAGIRNVSVSVTRQQPSAMVDALRDCDIDLVVLWSLWPETFSFAAYEAMAAGALIVTHADAGNIARLVLEYGAGWVRADEDRLAELLRSEELRDTVLRRRAEGRNGAALGRSRFSADLLREAATKPTVRRGVTPAAR